MKKLIIYFVCTCFMFFIIYFINKQMNYTEIEIMNQYLQNRNLPLVENVIYKSDISPTKKLILYNQSSDYISTIILDKGLFNYKVLNYFGSINPFNENQMVAYKTGSMYTRALGRLDTTDEYLIWGILYNPSITDIYYDNYNAVDQLETEYLHLFYYISEEPIEPNKLSFFDANNNSIE